MIRLLNFILYYTGGARTQLAHTRRRTGGERVRTLFIIMRARVGSPLGTPTWRKAYVPGNFGSSTVCVNVSLEKLIRKAYRAGKNPDIHHSYLITASMIILEAAMSYLQSSMDRKFTSCGTNLKCTNYIFVSKNSGLKIQKHAVLSDSKDLKYPSDHLPVLIQIN